MEGRRETRSIHQKWNITSCSSCDTHLGSSPGWGKIPIPRGVMINNAFVWRCERRYSKAFAYLTCQFLLSSRGHAMLLWRVCVCGGVGAVFTHLPSCVIYFTPWCFHLSCASEEINTHKAGINTGPHNFCATVSSSS